MAQLVKHLTLDLGSGLNLRVTSSSPTLGSMLGMELLNLKKRERDWRVRRSVCPYLSGAF